MANSFDFNIQSRQDLESAVETFGIVPLFANSIPGFSVEEHVSPEVWFTDQEGVWEWKGPVIRNTGCAYGKLLEKKAVFMRRDLYAELANLRRDGYDFDARFDDGLASFGDRDLYDLVAGYGPIRSGALKRMGNYGKAGNKGFDTRMNRLQGQCYLLISDFAYDIDRYGRPFGWGAAVYATPEQTLGDAFCRSVYRHSCEESYHLLLEHLTQLLPGATQAQLDRLLRKI